MTQSTRFDVHTHVTRAIVTAIETGAGTWRMPWHHPAAAVTRPANVASGRPYRGINTISLWASANRSGFGSGLWGTYRQWQALGAQVRKGEHASPAVLWKDLGTLPDADGEPNREYPGGHQSERRVRRVARSFNLFNADQVDGYVAAEQPLLPEGERLAGAERFIAALAIETTFGAPQAYYSIGADRIFMPDFGQFHDAHGFYATYLHECAHASGAAHRLDRNLADCWSETALALEEITAELTASFVLADLGMAHDPRPDHAAYIATWVALLKSQPRAIFTAASRAQAAADWMHARQP